MWLGEAQAFHWPLEFPEVFAAGGFDVVLGNPPWEVMQLSEEEFFAQHMSDIAGLKGAARKRAIASLGRVATLTFLSDTVWRSAASRPAISLHVLPAAFK